MFDRRAVILCCQAIEAKTGGGLLRPYQTLKLNNLKTVKYMTTTVMYYAKRKGSILFCGTG